MKTCINIYIVKLTTVPTFKAPELKLSPLLNHCTTATHEMSKEIIACTSLHNTPKMLKVSSFYQEFKLFSAMEKKNLNIVSFSQLFPYTASVTATSTEEEIRRESVNCLLTGCGTNQVSISAIKGFNSMCQIVSSIE